MSSRQIPTVVIAVVVVMLMWAVLPANPYSYYVLLRWVCCPALAYVAWLSFAGGNTNWGLGLAIAALVYNPFAKIGLTRGVWTVVNLVTIVLLLTFLIRFSRGRIARTGPHDSHVSDQNQHLDHAIPAFVQRPQHLSREKPVAPASVAKNRWPPSGSDDDRVSSLKLIEPAIEKFPWLSFVVDIIWAPLLFPLVLTSFVLLALDRPLRSSPRTWNLIVSLNTQLIPAICVFFMGRALITLPETAARLAGWWFSVAGAVGFTLEIVAIGIAIGKLRRRRSELIRSKEIMRLSSEARRL